MADIKVSQAPIQPNPGATTVLLAISGGAIVQVNLSDLATAINSGVLDSISDLAYQISTNPVNLSDPGLLSLLQQKVNVLNPVLQGATVATTPAIAATGNEVVNAAWVRQWYAGLTQTTNAPINTVLPAVTGSTSLSSVLTCSTGTWTGTATITFTYQWQRNSGTAGAYVNISSATASTYTIVSADQGFTLRCVVTGTNGVGSGIGTSAGTAIPASASLTFTTAPVVTGTIGPGNTLTATTGTASPTPTSYTGQWLRDGTVINGSTATTFGQTSADQGHNLNYVSTAYLGAQTANSASNTIIVPPAPSTTITQTFTSMTTEIPNPERGFYDWGGSFYLTGFDSGSLSSLKSNGNTIAIGLIDLSAYRTTATIPSSYFTTLNSSFALVRNAGVKVIVRPVYNYADAGQEATEAIMTGHISQLASTWEANKDIIAFMQAGYIGPYGEWWAGTNTTIGNDAAAKLRIMTAIMANTPKELFVCFRYPKDIIARFPTPISSAAKLGDLTDQSRTASHNDCFLADPTNGGTWQSSAQKTYMASNQKYLPMTGETCDGSAPDYSGAGVTGDGAAYGWTSLNINYSTTFISNWKATTYNGENLFNIIRRSLGYRLIVTQVQHLATATAGSASAMSITVNNVGWNRVHSARQLVVVLRNNNTGTVTTVGGDFIRQVGAGETKVITVNYTAPQAGTYSVFLAVPDVYSTTSTVPSHAIRFANANDATKGQTWDATNARFSTGTTITVS